MIPEYLEVMGQDYIDHVVDVSKMVKCAMKKNAAATAIDPIGSVNSLWSSGINTLMTLSVVTGVPVGILAHVVGKNIAKKKNYEKELIMEAEKYREAAKALEREMARQQLKVV